MKNRNWNYSLLFSLFALILVTGCKKDDNSPSNTVKDIDGNVYHTVTIGTQVWMVENLKTTKYNDGTPIPIITDDSAWSELSTPGYSWYNNNETTHKEVYGALYNWYTVNTGKLCPAGWHVPSDEEWIILLDFYGGDVIAGDKLKASISSGWNTNTPGTEKNKFAALPGGYRKMVYRNMGTFYYLGINGYWWSTTEAPVINSYSHSWSMEYGSSWVMRYSYLKEYGLSVRCLKDK